jgi:hypothetical protein
MPQQHCTCRQRTQASPTLQVPSTAGLCILTATELCCCLCSLVWRRLAPPTRQLEMACLNLDTGLPEPYPQGWWAVVIDVSHATFASQWHESCTLWTVTELRRRICDVLRFAGVARCIYSDIGWGGVACYEALISVGSRQWSPQQAVVTLLCATDI